VQYVDPLFIYLFIYLPPQKNKIKNKFSNKDSAIVACDHWNRVDEDIGLMKDLGVNSYRFSIEWSKLEPSQGQWDEVKSYFFFFCPFLYFFYSDSFRAASGKALPRRD